MVACLALLASANAESATILAPSNEAVVKGRLVRVSIAVPRGGVLVAARVDRRSISGRLGRTAGGRRVAVLSRRALGVGAHRLLVVVRDRHGRRRAASTRFWVGRRVSGLARVALPRGSLSARPVGVAIRTPRRLEWLKVRLNGRLVSRAFRLAYRHARRGMLSPSHGVRFGRNVLRVLALTPDGRFTRVVRVFAVRRDRPLAGAGMDRRVVAGAGVRLDGRASRAAQRNRRLAFRWMLVRRPRGSRATIVGAHGARPRLRTDRYGRYRVRLRVGELGGRAASAAAVSASAGDDVDVVARPDDPPIGVAVHTIDASNQGAITLGGDPLPIPAPPPSAPTGTMTVHAVVLDRGSRDVLLNQTYCSGAGCDGADDTRTLPALQAAINSGNYGPGGTSNSGSNGPPLIILSAVHTSQSPAVTPIRTDNFNDIVQQLGGQPFTAQALGDQGSVSVIGVPGADAGDAWQNSGLQQANPARSSSATPGAAGDLGGFLTYGPQDLYEFTSPDYVPFNTSANATQPATSNTITIAGKPAPGSQGGTYSLPSGQQGAFHVLALDAGTLRPVFENHYDPSNGDQVAAMGDQLNQFAANPDALVIVQSVGTVKPTTANWGDLAQMIEKLGGNRAVFNGVDGSYMLIGGAGVDAQEASSALTNSPAQSVGLLARGHDGRYSVRLSDPLGRLNYELLPLVYKDPVPWPCSEQGAACDAAHQAAGEWLMDQIKTKVDLGETLDDLREQYWQNTDQPWNTVDTTLSTTSCPEGGGTGWTYQDCEDVRQEIDLEVVWVDEVQKLFGPPGSTLTGSMQQPFATGNALGLINNITTSANNLQDALTPIQQNSRLSVDGLYLAEGITDFISSFGDEVIPGSFGIVTAMLEMADSVTSNSNGDAKTAGTLRNIQTSANQLGQTLSERLQNTVTNSVLIGQTLVSDYGKLAVAHARSANRCTDESDNCWWTASSPQGASNGLIVTTRSLGATTLLPLAYQAWVFVPTDKNKVLSTTNKYGCRVCTYGHPCLVHATHHPWGGAPLSAQFLAISDWTGPDGNVKPTYVMWGLATPISEGAVNGPPPQDPKFPTDTVTGPLFAPAAVPPSPSASTGLGLQKPWFFVDTFARQQVTCSNGSTDFGPLLQPGTPVPDG